MFNRRLTKEEREQLMQPIWGVLEYDLESGEDIILVDGLTNSEAQAQLEILSNKNDGRILMIRRTS